MGVVGTNDFTLIVDQSGIAVSPKQIASRLSAFAVKCDDLSTWQFDILDRDGFPIFSSDAGIGVLTGPTNIPVDRRCADFVLHLKDATPGTYLIRCSID